MATTKKTIKIPKPTAWPIVSALGLTLVFAGFLTTWLIGIAGGILCSIGFIGWFKDRFPNNLEISVEVEVHHLPAEVSSTRSTHEEHPYHRAMLPLEIHRLPAGLLGGIAGGAAMLIVSVIGSYIIHGTPWYPFNVMSASVMHSITEQHLNIFNATAFVVALGIHATLSICIGLIYAVVLPLLPKHPIILGALIIPFIWSFLLYSAMNTLNPVLDATVNWWWFLIAQLVFGLVAGFVVSKSEKIQTLQFKAFAERAGIEKGKE
jgi:hypothetical protein